MPYRHSLKYGCNSLKSVKKESGVEYRKQVDAVVAEKNFSGEKFFLKNSNFYYYLYYFCISENRECKFI